jgi:hypothetical protein
MKKIKVITYDEEYDLYYLDSTEETRVSIAFYLLIIIAILIGIAVFVF